MNDTDEMLKDSAVRYFSDLCTRDVLDDVEQGKWFPEVWTGLQDIGLVSAASVAIEEGVNGLPLDSLCMLARQAGRFNVPLPLVETYVAQRILMDKGIAFDDGAPLAVSTLAMASKIEVKPAQKPSNGYVVNGSIARVAWGRHCAGVVVEGFHANKAFFALLPRGEVSARQSNLAGESRDTLMYNHVAVAPECVVFTDHDQGCEQRVFEGALFRCMQITGALQRALEMTLDYAKTREQFGRPIAKFQAIQHQIAEMAAQVASATAAADAAAHASALGQASAQIAMAKIRCSEAAGLACAIAHQVHGAMGFTHEHSLHFTTRRLASWRDEFGAESHWADWLGRRLQGLSENDLWRFITSPCADAISNVEDPTHE